MQMPPPDPDTLFEDLLQDLPAETTAMAREFKAFVRANWSYITTGQKTSQNHIPSLLVVAHKQNLGNLRRNHFAPIRGYHRMSHMGCTSDIPKEQSDAPPQKPLS
jgi:hypothetical protein